MSSDHRPAHIAVGICTFRRLALIDTLRSLADLETAGLQVTMIVADNDDAPTARPRVEPLLDRLPLPIVWLHAPARNISVARNAILDEAMRRDIRFLAFIDDDEVAESTWLVRLAEAMRQTQAAAVMGRVLAEYPPGAPSWMREGAVHDTAPVMTRQGGVIGGYAGNVLLDLGHPAVAGRRFDFGRGVSGGEDTAFFAGILAAGGCLAYDPEARVREPVPPERATLRWLLRRRFRMGQTHGGLQRQGASVVRRAALTSLALAKAGACFAMAAAGGLDAVRRNRQLMRATLHVGASAALLGVADLPLYGATEEREAGARLS